MSLKKTTASQACAGTNSSQFGRNQPLDSARGREKKDLASMEKVWQALHKNVSVLHENLSNFIFAASSYRH